MKLPVDICAELSDLLIQIRILSERLASQRLQCRVGTSREPLERINTCLALAEPTLLWLCCLACYLADLSEYPLRLCLELIRQAEQLLQAWGLLLCQVSGALP